MFSRDASWLLSHYLVERIIVLLAGGGSALLKAMSCRPAMLMLQAYNARRQADLDALQVGTGPTDWSMQHTHQAALLGGAGRKLTSTSV